MAVGLGVAFGNEVRSPITFQKILGKRYCIREGYYKAVAHQDKRMSSRKFKRYAYLIGENFVGEK